MLSGPSLLEMTDKNLRLLLLDEDKRKQVAKAVTETLKNEALISLRHKVVAKIQRLLPEELKKRYLHELNKNLNSKELHQIFIAHLQYRGAYDPTQNFSLIGYKASLNDLLKILSSNTSDMRKVCEDTVENHVKNYLFSPLESETKSDQPEESFQKRLNRRLYKVAVFIADTANQYNEWSLCTWFCAWLQSTLATQPLPEKINKEILHAISYLLFRAIRDAKQNKIAEQLLDAAKMYIENPEDAIILFDQHDHYSRGNTLYEAVLHSNYKMVINLLDMVAVMPSELPRHAESLRWITPWNDKLMITLLQCDREKRKELLPTIEHNSEFKSQLKEKLQNGSSSSEPYLGKRYMSPEEMAVAVKGLKKNAQLKKRNFNCSVLTAEGYKLMELNNFLLDLAQHTAEYEGRRFQFVFSYKSDYMAHHIPHWISGDVRVYEGNLEFYVVEAYNRPTTYFTAIALIYQNCPSAKINLSILSIQEDEESCGLFALSHAEALSKIENLYDLLSEEPTYAFDELTEVKKMKELIAERMKSTAYYEYLDPDALLEAVKKTKLIFVDTLSFELGALLKNAQTEEKTNYYYFITKRGFVYHDKKKKVEDHIQRDHAKLMELQDYSINVDAIYVKMIKIHDAMLSCIDTMTEQEIQQLIDNRTAVDLVLLAPEEAKKPLSKTPAALFQPKQPNTESMILNIADFKTNMLSELNTYPKNTLNRVTDIKDLLKIGDIVNAKEMHEILVKINIILNKTSTFVGPSKELRKKLNPYLQAMFSRIHIPDNTLATDFSVPEKIGSQKPGKK